MRDDVEFVQGVHKTALDWLELKTRQERKVQAERRWFTHEMQSGLEMSRPMVNASAVRARMQKAGIQARRGPRVRRL